MSMARVTACGGWGCSRPGKRRRSAAPRAGAAGHGRLALRRAYAYAALAAVLAAAGCASGPPERPPWRITEADAGRSIRVPIGTVLDVALPGNPTTGHIWERSPGDPGGVETLGAARFAPSGAAPGQGGLVHLSFRVTKTGATPLWLIYRRPFEKDVPPAKTFSVTVVGEPD